MNGVRMLKFRPLLQGVLFVCVCVCVCVYACEEGEIRYKET